MAAIVQVDPYASLIRKIGYSVGLEDVVNRVKKLVAVYVEEGVISGSSFRQLVEVEFGRKNAAEHFANFYAALNLIRTTVWDSVRSIDRSPKKTLVPKSIEPLHYLDALAILRRQYATDNEKYDVAFKCVLTQAILEADGDIFLNALIAKFNAEEMRIRFETMIRMKRQLLGHVLRLPSVMQRISRIIEIKNESDRSKDGGTDGDPVGRFGRRTAALGSSRRTTNISGETSNAISIPTDYLGKVGVSRQGWANDLGLSTKAGQTESGSTLIAMLETTGEPHAVVRQIDGRGTALFWGYRSELLRLRIEPKEIEATDWESWDLSRLISESFVGESSGPPSADKVFTALAEIFDLYRSIGSKQLIRNSLPLYVAEPVLAARCAAERKRSPDLGLVLSREFAKKTRRVQRMIVRGTTGALFFSKDTK